MAEVRSGEEMYLSFLGLSPAMNYFTSHIEIREQAVKVTGTKEGCSMQNRGRLSTGGSPSQWVWPYLDTGLAIGGLRGLVLARRVITTPTNSPAAV